MQKILGILMVTLFVFTMATGFSTAKQNTLAVPVKNSFCAGDSMACKGKQDTTKCKHMCPKGCTKKCCKH
jgi:hypothetical protein